MCCSCPIAPAELASTSSPLSPLKLAYYHQLMIDRLIRRRKKAGIRNPASTFLAHPKIYPRRHPRSTRKTEVITLNYMPLRKISYEDTVNNPCEKVFFENHSRSKAFLVYKRLGNPSIIRSNLRSACQIVCLSLYYYHCVAYLNSQLSFNSR